jgi:hypothetical protein
MREIVGVCAVIGGIVELIAAVGGPRLTGIGMLTNEPPPAMETGPLLVGIAVALISIVAGSLVTAGRSGQFWGIVLLVAAAVGVIVVGPWTGWFTLGAAFTVLAGALSLFVRKSHRTTR